MRKAFRIGICLIVLLGMHTNQGFAQISPNSYVPCQEMPNLLQNYEADLRALTRFYTSAFYGNRYQGNATIEGASPDRKSVV